MTLLSLLAVLLIRHSANVALSWQEKRPVHWYLDKLVAHQEKVKQPIWLYLVGVCVLPSVILGLILAQLSGLLPWLLSTGILFFCMQDGNNRAHYKQVMKSMSRQDLEAVAHHCEKLGCDEPATIGQHLLLNNYQHYAAVILMFVILGAPGALAFVIASVLAQRAVNDEQFEIPAQQVLRAFDFIPSRVVTFGYLVVGNFSRALPMWLDKVFHYNLSVKDFIVSVASAADDVSVTNSPEIEKLAAHVNLAKRTVALLVVMVALMTILGGLN